MEQITIQVDDSNKAKLLLDLFKSLDFVNSVSIQTEVEEEDNASNEEENFFEAAGLWKDRDVSLDSIRKNAWPRQAS